MLVEDALLLRIYVGEQDRHAGGPLYDAIVRRARERHLAGATVLRGPLGFGRSSRMHRAGLLDLSEDLPMVIEIVDAEARIQAFLPILGTMMSSGLVTLERVRVVRYGPGSAEGSDGEG